MGILEIMENQEKCERKLPLVQNQFQIRPPLIINNTIIHKPKNHFYYHSPASISINMSAQVETKKDVGLTKLLMTETGSNPRGIPAAKFIENVDEFLGETAIEAALGAYQELYGKYKYMESHFEKSKSVYKGKVPDIEQTLDTVQLLLAQKEAGGELVHTNYSLSDTVYAKAKVLWNSIVWGICVIEYEVSCCRLTQALVKFAYGSVPVRWLSTLMRRQWSY